MPSKTKVTTSNNLTLEDIVDFLGYEIQELETKLSKLEENLEDLQNAREYIENTLFSIKKKRGELSRAL
jgi:prefoldin subunit 5